MTLFVVGRTAQAPVQPPGSQGLLCLDGSIGRYVRPGEFELANAAGVFGWRLTVGLSPTPAGEAAALAGGTWRLQCWHRDLAPAPTSNLTGGIEALWQ